MGIAKGHKYFTNDEKMPLVSRKIKDNMIKKTLGAGPELL